MKKVVLATFIGMCLLLASSASKVQALPNAYYDDWYFSDPGFSDWVGERYSMCDSGVYAWGTTAPYLMHWDIDCVTGNQYATCYYIDPWTGGRSGIACP